MKIEALNQLGKGNVVVRLEFLDMNGIVYEAVELARFRNMSWADNFVAGIRADEESLTTSNCRYVVEEVKK